MQKWILICKFQNILSCGLLDVNLRVKQIEYNFCPYFSFITSLSHLSWLTVKMSVSNTWDISVPTGIFSCPFSKSLNAFICVNYLGFSIVALTIWEQNFLRKKNAIVANLRKTRYQKEILSQKVLFVYHVFNCCTYFLCLFKFSYFFPNSFAAYLKKQEKIFLETFSFN